MQHLKFALVVGAFILTALPVYAAEGAPGENAGAATAGHPITPQELQKACGPLISDARAQRIAFFKEYIRMTGRSKGTKQLLARARDKTIPDANWYINWSYLGPGFTDMLDDNIWLNQGRDIWLNEGRDPQHFLKVIARLSGSVNAEQKDPQTIAGICAMRAHVAALEGTDASNLAPGNGSQASAIPAKPVAPSPASSLPSRTDPLYPYHPTVKADLEYACADEIRLAEMTSPRTAWFQDSWVSLFKRERYISPSEAFNRIRKETRSKRIPFHYLDACAAVVFFVQDLQGVGNGEKALAQWRKLRADYEPLLSAGKPSTYTAVPIEHDTRCEVRSGCSIIEDSQEICPLIKEAWLKRSTGGSCSNGLIEGIVQHWLGDRGGRETTDFQLYQQGRLLLRVQIVSGPDIPSGTSYSVYKFHGQAHVDDQCTGNSTSERVKSDPLCEEAARTFGTEIFANKETTRDADLEEINKAFGNSRK